MEKCFLFHEMSPDFIQLQYLVVHFIFIFYMISDALEVIVSYLSEMLDSGNCLRFKKLGYLHSLRKLIAEIDDIFLNIFKKFHSKMSF